MISEKTIDEIFSTVQIEEVVSDFVQLKKRGANQLGLCPFHNEKTPSFTVSPSKNIYKCFGCGRGGNTVQFVMEHEQMSYPEALRFLAEKYDIKIEETKQSFEDKERQSERESMMIANQYAQDFFRDSLVNSPMGKSVGLSYFKKRSFPQHVIESFGLGFSPESGKAWIEHSKKIGVNPEISRAIGLTTEKGYDFFRGRVMFPIHNVAGRIIAFAGRSLSNDKRSPKYINSPETLIYDKSKTLYALHLAKKSMVKEDECILVEGYTDVISMHMQGIENVVASSGTSLTDGQTRMIKRFTQNVMILYDGDLAGQKAAIRGIDILLQQDLNVRIVLLPDGHDPDSFIQDRGVNGFRDFVKESAQDFILFKSSQLADDAKSNPIRKTVIIKDIVSSISLIPDALKRSMYLKEVAQQFEVEEEILMDHLGDKIRSKKKREQRTRPQDKPKPSETLLKKVSESEQSLTDEFQERDILRILIGLGHNSFPGEENYTIGEYVIDHLKDIIDSPDLFDMPIFQKIVWEYKRILAEKQKVSPNDFINHADMELSQTAVDLLSEKYVYSENWAQRHDIHLNTQETPELNFRPDCESSLLRLKLRKINKMIEKNKKELTDPTASIDDQKMRVNLEVHSRLLYQRNQIAEMLRQVIL